MYWNDIINEDHKTINVKKSDLESYINQINPLAIENFKQGIYILRGIESSNRAVIANGNNRESRYATNNLYNLLISNLQDWSAYPKRSNSLVCTTSITKPKSYGDIYVVVPMGDPTIGICNNSDIWDSFKTLNKIGYDNLDRFNRNLYKALRDMCTYSGISFDTHIDKNYDKLIELINRLDSILDVKQENGNTLRFNIERSSGYHFYIEEFLSKGTLLDSINYLLNPKLNGFKIKKYNNFTETGNKEVWFEGAAALFKYKYYKAEFQNIGLDAGE